MKNVQKIPNREEYIEVEKTAITFSPREELVPLKDSVGRVSSRSVSSNWTIPDVPLSAMDGISYRYDNYVSCNGDTSRWKLGVDFNYSNTGCALNHAYDTVSLIENVSVLPQEGVEFLVKPQYKGQNVNPAGSMLKEGEEILPKNFLITPGQLGVLAAGGVRQVPVYVKPKVVIIPTGVELQPSGLPLQSGMNIETNSLVIGAYVEQWGGEPIIYPIVPDSESMISRVLCQALEEGDIVVLNAGSSKGSRDFAIRSLASLGNVLCEQVGHGPAKKTSFTVANGKPIVGLVGPAVPAEMTVGWYVRPLIDAYLGIESAETITIEAKLTDPAKNQVPFDFYMSVIVYKNSDGAYLAKPLIDPKFKHSDMSSSAMGLTIDQQPHSMRVQMSTFSNGYLKMSAGDSFEAGEIVPIELKYSHLQPFHTSHIIQH